MSESDGMQNQAEATYLRSSGVAEQVLGQETILVKRPSQAVHVLNAAAYVIWELCDGRHTVSDMEQVLRVRFHVDLERDIRSEIAQAIGVLVQKELVVTPESFR
jgi:hypothetical protein